MYYLFNHFQKFLEQDYLSFVCFILSEEKITFFVQVEKVAIVNEKEIIIFVVKTSWEIRGKRNFVTKPTVFEKIEAPRGHLRKSKAGEKISFCLSYWTLKHPQFHTPSIQHISSTQEAHSFSALKIPQFNTKKPPVPQHPQLHTGPNSTNPSVQPQKTLSMLNWKGFGCWIEGCVELRGLWNWGVCWTERVVYFWVLKSCCPCVELRESVWNWGLLVSNERIRPFEVLIKEKFF